MNSIAVSTVVFLCVFGSALFGMFLSPLLPVRHHASESKDAVKLGMGLVATTVAVSLGLLIGSAKNFYDTQSNEMAQGAANYILLDRVLVHYGPETTDARTALHGVLADQLKSSEPSENTNQTYRAIRSGSRFGEGIVSKIQELSPKDDNQRLLKSQAMSVAFQIGQTRWLMFEQNAVPVPKLMLAMLLGWLVVLFLSFGIFAPRNLTVLVGLFLAAVAVFGVIFLILEMFQPHSGLIQVSDAPLRQALTLVEQ
jgi:hypothetical protein